MKESLTYRMVVSRFDEQTIKDFLDIPKMLYEKDCPQDKTLEYDILHHQHCLSNQFTIKPFVVYDVTPDGKTPVARCLVTLYKDDDIAYIGFFESINNKNVADVLFKSAINYIISCEKTKVVGPVDCSFWLKYRFKHESTLDFKRSYTGEPYNKDYYVDLWKHCGFEISNTYESNFYRKPTLYDISDKLKNRLDWLKKNNYKLVNMNLFSFNKHFKKIYELIIDAYSGFPIYKPIDFKDFKYIFGNLKYLLNYSMVKLVYDGDKLAGFVVNIPNYNLYSVDNFNIINLFKILKARIKPKEYVLMYIAIDKSYLGIGSALAEATKNELVNNECTSIGALVIKGKVSGNYYKDLMTDKTTYVLLEKNLD